MAAGIQNTKARFDATVNDRRYNLPSMTLGANAVRPLSFEWTDTVNRSGPVPRYRQVIAHGGNATSSLSGSKKTVECAHSDCWMDSRNNTTGTGNRWQVIGPIMARTSVARPSSTLSMSSVGAMNQSLSRYYADIAGVETAFKGMVFTGELRQSLSLIRHPARALRNGIDDYLSLLRSGGRRLSLRDRPKFVRDTWLEYSYGWSPLISDLDGAITAFYKSKHVRALFELCVGIGEVENVVGIASNATAHSWGDCFVRYDAKEVEKVNIRTFGVYRSTGDGVSNIHHYGFRPSEFIPTLWELIPYSFLVDYFSNAGKILESWSYRWLGPSWTARTTYRESVWSTFNHRVINPSPVAGVTYTPGGSIGSCVSTKSSFSRQPNVPLDLPTLEFKVPGKWSQWVNIVALTKNLQTTRNVLRL